MGDATESSKCVTPPCSMAEWIAATNLLRGWIKKNKGERPGGWDYDKETVRLVEESAALLGIEDPWK